MRISGGGNLTSLVKIREIERQLQKRTPEQFKI
jgi:hypothetical protein